MLTKNYYYKYLLLFAAVLFCTISKAQPTNFIHIQSDDNQPYIIQLNGNTYSSSATGYIVIPQVPVGAHTLVVGFPRNLFPEYSFNCTIADKPRGFSLKQGIDNSWSLFDMVNFTVIKGALTSKEPALGTVSPVVQIPIETIPAKPVGELIVLKDKPVAPPSRIQKIYEKVSAGGIDQVYIVVNRGKADTVALFIPVIKGEPTKEKAMSTKPSQNDREKQSKIEAITVFFPQIARRNLLSK